MKALMIGLVATLGIASVAKADTTDLNTFTTLLEVGVDFEQEMSHTIVTVDSVDCQISLASNDTECRFFDVSAKQGQGDHVELTGAKAEKLAALLESLGGEMDSGMGHTWVSVQRISCSQVAEGVAEGDEAERTSCTVEVSEQDPE